MLRWRVGLAFATFVVVSLAGSAPALADGGYGNVDCSSSPRAPECEITAGTPGDVSDRDGGDRGSVDGAGSGGEESSCRYERVRPQAPPPAGTGEGAWYRQVCDLDGGGAASQATWLPTGQVADPRALGQQAVSRLRLPAPAIRTNPDSAAGVLVQVPVWLWVDSSTWGARRATASVPGMSVTATATPVRVRWSPGDGSRTVVCEGPGTPWRAGTDPRAKSSCGHTYRTSSAGAAGDRFTLQATVTWSVTWAGGGQSGTVAPLTTTSSVALTVAQSQAIVAG